MDSFITSKRNYVLLTSYDFRSLKLEEAHASPFEIFQEKDLMFSFIPSMNEAWISS